MSNAALKSSFEVVLDAVDGRPEAQHALDNEECRLDYRSALCSTLATHGWA